MSSSRSSRRQSENSSYTVMDRSNDRSRQDSRMIREELPMLSIHEDEPSRYDSRAPQESRSHHTGDRRQSRTATASRYDSRAPQESRTSSMGDRTATASRYDSRAPQESRTSSMGDNPYSRTATASRYDSRAPQESRISSMGDNPYSRTPTASRYESRAPPDSRYASRGDTQQSRTPTYMDPSKPLVMERAPAPRHRSRASSSQMTDMDPMQTVMERSRDNADRGDRHDASHVYEEVTIRITRKISHRSSHRG